MAAESLTKWPVVSRSILIDDPLKVRALLQKTDQVRVTYCLDVGFILKSTMCQFAKLNATLIWM